MEELIIQAAGIVIALLDWVMLAVVVVGTLGALVRLIRELIKLEALLPGVRAIWLNYAAWILLALELALAADLVETVIAPSWQQIGRLGAIAAIRIALGFFLGRDIGEYRADLPQSR